MRVGLILPSFQEDFSRIIETSRQAESLGLDGVFAFDHLWPMGQMGRPAFSAFPTLAAVAVATKSIHLGTLVARVSMVDNEILIREISALEALAPGRVIAGIGTGDSKSSDELTRCGLAFGSSRDRLENLSAVAQRLTAGGSTVWLGAGSSRILEIAKQSGSAVNFWAKAPGSVDTEAARARSLGIEVTWAGHLDGTADDYAKSLTDMARAGATWAVLGWPESLEVAAAASRMIDRNLGAFPDD